MYGCLYVCTPLLFFLSGYVNVLVCVYVYVYVYAYAYAYACMYVSMCLSIYLYLIQVWCATQPSPSLCWYNVYTYIDTNIHTHHNVGLFINLSCLLERKGKLLFVERKNSTSRDRLHHLETYIHVYILYVGAIR